MAFEPNWVKLAHSPLDLAEGGSYLFWHDQELNFIHRVKTDATGLNEEFLATPEHRRIAADGTYVYYKEGTNIARAKHDGTEVLPKFIELVNQPNGIAVTATHVYWADEFAKTIGRAAIGGGEVEPEWVKIGSAVGPGEIAVNSEHIYWTYSGPGKEEHFVGRCAIGGGAVEGEWLNTGQFNYAIAVSNAFIWLAPEPGNYVSRAETSGAGFVKEWLALPESEASGFAYDAEHFYVAIFSNKSIGRMTIEEAGGEVAKLKPLTLSSTVSSGMVSLL